MEYRVQYTPRLETRFSSLRDPVALQAGDDQVPSDFLRAIAAVGAKLANC
jgi:hypothetical protein